MTYETILDAVRSEMSESPTQEVIAAMAVRDLMSATLSLSELSAGKSTAGLVRLEANDIELAYTRLGRMLSHLRKEQSRAA